MSRDAQRPGTAGFALTEALVAALLLALALLGAGAALVESLRAQHAALLQARAADLAADLAEAIRGQASAAEFTLEMASWRARVASTLPGSTAHAARVADSGGTTGDLDIQLRWRESGVGRVRTLRLPVASAIPP